MKRNKAPITITSPRKKIERLFVFRSPSTLIDKTYLARNIYFNMRSNSSYGSLGWNTNNNVASKYLRLESNKRGTTITLTKDLDLNFIHNAQSSEFKKVTRSSGIKVNKNTRIDLNCIGTITGNLKCSLNILEYDKYADRTSITRVHLNNPIRYIPPSNVKKIVLNLRLEGTGRLLLKEIELNVGTSQRVSSFSKTSDAGLRGADLSATRGLIPSLYQATQSKPRVLKNIRIAGIMDPFTQHSYEHECDVMQLHPEAWQQQLIDFAPHFVFIESAWQGLENLWKTKISNNSDELQAILSWCKGQKIPTMLWNKEDPVHYSKFLKVAKQVDYIFTTDIDCVPKYKYDCDTKDVFFLPFAAQTKNHNPIESFPRKDAFCFAGSYYLRYPERQQDIGMLSETVSKYKPLEIYDRNFDNDHPHYQFPDSFSKYIVGTLPFDKIDIAYKGYKYGINLNTIKESQSMYARRVYELMASNTIVISNFSRGMRRMFGDLVISSDESTEIEKRISPLISNENYYKKLRLLALRKVMNEHTYKHRLTYLVDTIKGWDISEKSQDVVVLATANSVKNIEAIKAQFNRQSYAHKFLCVHLKNSDDSLEQRTNNVLVTADLNKIHSKVKASSFVGIFSNNDYYGENYLFDAMLATKYSDADGIGKHCHYDFIGQETTLQNPGTEYQHTPELMLHRSITRSHLFDEEKSLAFLNSPEKVKLSGSLKLLALDEFNYCANVMEENPELYRERIDDISELDTGASLTPLYSTANKLPASKHDDHPKSNSNQFDMTAEDFYNSIPQPKSRLVSLSLKDGDFLIESRLDKEQTSYAYCDQYYLRDELNLTSNSEFKTVCDTRGQHLKIVFEFLDEDKTKLSHHMSGGSESTVMAIPAECKYIRVGIRMQGTGTSTIRKLIIGKNKETPHAIIANDDTLVLTKQYASYNDIYKYGFLHSRIKSYVAEGKNVDIFRLKPNCRKFFDEYENIDVASGDHELLSRTLETGQYKNLLVHILDRKMWETISPFIHQLNVTVWIHGAEIQHWSKRDFDFEALDQDGIERAKALAENRLKFWEDLFADCPENLSFVFVSQQFADSALGDLSIDLPKEKYSIIHNPIDTQLFDHIKKDQSQRTKILSIRPYASRVYANDLSIDAILQLSQEPFFDSLEFRLVGDGELFDETVAPVRDFPNVEVSQGFLPQSEIAELHKEYGVFLCPSRMDTQGVSRDEAMSSGLVPITNKVAAIPEFVDETCGILAPPNNADALAEGIKQLFEDPDLFIELSRNASKRVETQSGNEKIVHEEMQLFS